MKNMLIIHGAYGHPGENWFGWLKEELEEKGYAITIPTLPTPEGQSLTNWTQIVDKLSFDFNSETILVGHSIGATFLLTLLERYGVGTTALVSGFISDLGDTEFDAINGSFYNKDFDWEAIKKNAGNSAVFHGDNDPYVPVTCAEELAEHLETEPLIVPDGGHFNTAAGFSEFPQLLEKIL